MPKICMSILLTLVFLVSSAFSQQAMQDMRNLKNGAAVRGLIIEPMPNVSVEVQAQGGNAFVYKVKDSLKIAKELLIGVQGASEREEKSPVLAFIMSCRVPGSGQYYNGDIAKGVIQEVFVAGGITLALAAAMSSSGGFYFENYSDDNEATTWIGVGLGVAGASYLWSIIDAPISAIRINKERESAYEHLLEFSADTKVIGFDPATDGKTIGAKFSMHFQCNTFRLSPFIVKSVQKKQRFF